MYKTENKNRKMRVHPASIRLLTDATWDFAHTMLWSNFPFSQAEVELAKTYIREYYQNIPADKFSSTASKHFTSYCERVLLAKNYVSRSPYRYIPHPCIWLNKHNTKGFAGTKRWYEENQRRKAKTIVSVRPETIVISINPIYSHFHFTA